MLLNKMKLGRQQAFEILPIGRKALSIFLAKTEKQKTGVRPVNRLLVIPVRNNDIARNALARFSFDAIAPFAYVAHLFHLSGLQGLFVWKQKVTTDAPDTYTA